jgi:glycosyltransferase involved in cell wall biosynthesis
MKRKKICVCSAQIPFTHGGTEVVAENLIERFQQRGHQAEQVRLPLQTQPHEELLKSCLAWRMIDLNFVELEQIDLAICLRFPAYMVRHQNKVIWLFHQYRQIYDLYQTNYSSFQPTSKDNEFRKYLIDLDHISFRESKKVFVQSRNVAKRLQQSIGCDSEILFPPISDAEKFHSTGFGDSILSVARLAGNKRVQLLIDAMQFVPNRFNAIIIGDGYAKKELMERTTQLGLQDRIHFAGHLGRQQVIETYATAGAVFYGPLDEDYGLATLEAFYARKPVITCRDSGGVLEFVNEKTGWVSEPEPGSIAACIEESLVHKERSREKGEEGYRNISFLSWDYVLDRLLETLQ